MKYYHVGKIIRESDSEYVNYYHGFKDPYILRFMLVIICIGFLLGVVVSIIIRIFS